MAVQTHRGSRALVFGALLAFVLITTGCTAEVPTPSPTPSPVPSGVLLTVETRGGMCAEGPCGASVFVERDGRVHQAAKPPNDLGVVSEAELAALDEQIRTTDFAELRSHPFTGTCPTAYDGQEMVFEFGAPGGIERVASCEVEIDYDAPLFAAVSNALGPFMAFPGAQ
jgi:hypothetical protein